MNWGIFPLTFPRMTTTKRSYSSSQAVRRTLDNSQKRSHIFMPIPTRSVGMRLNSLMERLWIDMRHLSAIRLGSIMGEFGRSATSPNKEKFPNNCDKLKRWRLWANWLAELPMILTTFLQLYNFRPAYW